MKSFETRLLQRIQSINSHLCVGLDPRPEFIDGSIEHFLADVIAQTSPYAAVYKPNIAYFEALGTKGYSLLEKVLTSMIPDDIPIILDAKRSDIPETQKYYARAYFEQWNVDAVTLNPLMGFDSLKPFLAFPDKAVYALAVTSNQGAFDFQFLEANNQKIFQHIFAMQEQAQHEPGSLGFVMGLTHLGPELISQTPDAPLLLPGLGAQGGKPEGLELDTRKAPVVFNSSRGILFGKEGDFASRANAVRERINNAFQSH